jgi:hypothetical protein
MGIVRPAAVMVTLLSFACGGGGPTNAAVDDAGTDGSPGAAKSGPVTTCTSTADAAGGGG